VLGDQIADSLLGCFERVEHLGLQRPGPVHSPFNLVPHRLAHPAIREHHKLLARGAVAQFNNVAHRSALAELRSLQGRLASIAEGSWHAVVQDFVALLGSHLARL
jgi:hypothetical protein